MLRRFVGILAALALLAAPVAAADVDLDIKKFKVSNKVKLRKAELVYLELTVENQSDTDRVCQVFVEGTQNGLHVYQMVHFASDPPGGGASTFGLEPFPPTDTGDIAWFVKVLDDDPDVDEAVALTEVLP